MRVRAEFYITGTEILTAPHSGSSTKSPTDFKDNYSLSAVTSGSYTWSPMFPPLSNSSPELLFTLRGPNNFVLTFVHSLKHFSIISLWTAHFSNALKKPNS